jgi:hypothetical protein
VATLAVCVGTGVVVSDLPNDWSGGQLGHFDDGNGGRGANVEGLTRTA